MICIHGYRCTTNLCLTSYIFSVQRCGNEGTRAPGCTRFFHPNFKAQRPNHQPFSCLTLASLHCFSPIFPPQDASWSRGQWPLSLAGLRSRTGHGADHQHSGRIYCVLVVGEMWVEPPNLKPSKRMPAQSFDASVFRFA